MTRINYICQPMKRKKLKYTDYEKQTGINVCLNCPYTECFFIKNKREIKNETHDTGKGIKNIYIS